MALPTGAHTRFSGAGARHGPCRRGRMLRKALLGIVPALVAFGCSAAPSNDEGTDAFGELTSDEATFLDFQFEGEVIAPSTVVARQAIITQLYYTEGRLTHLGGNSRPGYVKLKGVKSEPAGEGLQKIKYKAELPVLWPARTRQPTEYRVAYPRQVDQASLDAFNAKYDGRCGKNEYGQATFWHDFDPGVEGCTLDADVVAVRARVVPSAGVSSEIKYPQYNKLYEDDLLKVVTVVGLDGWTDSPGDVGVHVFERFISDVKGLITDEREVSRGVNDFVLRDVTVTGKVSGKNYEHTFLLVSQMEHANESFYRRFDEVTAKADIVTYDGHSGLGKNIKAVTSRGAVERGQYQIWFLDGCNSLGYVDASFTERRRTANGRTDPKGTKFLDLIGNALPSQWPWDESTSFKLVRALSNPDAPKTYDQILDEFPSNQVAAVIGDEDNTYNPR